MYPIILKGSIRVGMNWCWPLAEIASSRSKLISNQCLPLLHRRSKCMGCRAVLQIFHSPIYLFLAPPSRWCNALLVDKEDDEETYDIFQEDKDGDVQWFVHLQAKPSCSPRGHHAGPCGAARSSEGPCQGSEGCQGRELKPHSLVSTQVKRLLVDSDANPLDRQLTAEAGKPAELSPPLGKSLLHRALGLSFKNPPAPLTLPTFPLSLLPPRKPHPGKPASCVLSVAGASSLHPLGPSSQLKVLPASSSHMLLDSALPPPATHRCPPIIGINCIDSPTSGAGTSPARPTWRIMEKSCPPRASFPAAAINTKGTTPDSFSLLSPPTDSLLFSEVWNNCDARGYQGCQQRLNNHQSGYNLKLDRLFFSWTTNTFHLWCPVTSRNQYDKCFYCVCFNVINTSTRKVKNFELKSRQISFFRNLLQTQPPTTLK